MITYEEYKKALDTVLQYLNEQKARLREVETDLLNISGEGKTYSFTFPKDITKDSSIEDCEFSVRTFNAIRSYSSGISSIASFANISKSSLMKGRGFGPKVIMEIEAACARVGIEMLP